MPTSKSSGHLPLVVSKDTSTGRRTLMILTATRTTQTAKKEIAA
jgi:hypothetical protein